MFFISGLIFNIPLTKAIIRDQTISTEAEKDTYVKQHNPDENYGGGSYFLLGLDIWDDTIESYFYFDFSDKPSDWEKAEIGLNLYSIDSTMTVNVYLIETAWEELTLTWNNKPAKGELIDSFLASEEEEYYIDVTDYIEGNNDISICLWIPDIIDYNKIQGSTKEGYSSPPQLIWTCSELATITVTNPTSESNWEDSNIYTITWTSRGTISRVFIGLYKESTYVEDVILYTDNDGSYDFYFSNLEDLEGEDYRIVIADYDDIDVYGASDYFSINVANADEKAILGFNPFLILGIFLLVSILLARKIKKKR